MERGGRGAYREHHQLGSGAKRGGHTTGALARVSYLTLGLLINREH